MIVAQACFDASAVDVAHTWAPDAATAVASPAALTVTLLLSDELHVTVVAIPALATTVALSCRVSPICTVALDGLTEAETLEGRSGSLTVTLSTEDDTELTIKRVPVSLATTPNHNPDVAPLEFDGNPVDPDASLTVDAGNDVEVHAALVGDPEEYTYVTTEGDTETRTEKPSWRWYTSGGTLSEVGDGSRGPSFADEGQTEATYSWITPEEPGTYTLAAVVLDGRGGMGWQRLDVVVQ